MGSALEISAPAKVNLCLHIGGRGADGYHQLVSLFQMVSLFDRIRICSLKDEDTLKLEGDFGFPLEENIITGAVKLFRRRTGLRRGVRISVEKRIPLGAGLGGGSSDAAAVIIGLNALFGGGLEPSALVCLAAELGSDVPFFLTSPAALVRGRGEIVEPVRPRADFALVLVYPGFPVASRQAYGWLDDLRGPSPAEGVAGPPVEPDVLKRMYLRTEPGAWRLFNSFTPVLTARFPLLAEIDAALKRAGAAEAGISGSGSSVFGLFVDRREARRAAGKLKRVYALVKFVEPIAKSPFAGLE